MKKYDLTISIVLYNTDFKEVENVVSKFINTIYKHRIFLVDNSPKDTFKNNFKDNNNVEYIFTGKNIGFGSGHNIAINKVKNDTKYHLVLNADVDFEISIIDGIFKYMEKHEDVGLLAPKILNPDGSIQYSSKLLPTPLNLIVRRFLPIKKVQDFFNYKYEFRFSNFDRIIEVPYLMGCFMFINSKVFKDIDGFDERFFMYPEDIDLTRRIYEKHKTIYFPEVTIVHKYGKGSYKSYKLLYYHATSMIKYFNKWGWIWDGKRRKINKSILSQFDQ